MAIEATTAAATPNAEKAAKVKDVLNDMDSRRTFPNPDEAIAYIGKAMQDYPDFGNYPVAAPGVSINEEGGLDFDADVYTDDTRVMVAVLTQRGEKAGESSVKAIVITPVPTYDSILSNPEGRAWAERILDKELNHVAVRQLRKADDIADVVDSMPKTLADYITSERAGGGILQAFEDLWRPIKTNMAKLSRSWRLANLSKKELRRACESAAYAEEYYPTLEKSKQGSLFVFALNGMIAQAKKDGLDPTIFQRWLDGRDEKKIDVAAEDEDEFSLDDLTAALDTPETSEDKPAGEGEQSDESEPETDGQPETEGEPTE